MKIKQYDSIEELLGGGTARYFAAAFRNYHVHMDTLTKNDDSLLGTIDVCYDGPARPRNEDVHLGSLEYSALAMRLGGHALNQLGMIAPTDIARGFASALDVKISHSLGTGQIPIRCRLLASRNSLNCVQGTCSTIEVDIGGNRCKLTIDHRGGKRYLVLPEAQKIVDTDGETQLYGTGYRTRGLHIDDVEMDVSNHVVRAKFEYDPMFAEESYQGIGTARHMLLPTESIQLFGQLMQALLYQMESTDRERCPNIWLRTMSLRCHRPLFGPSGSAFVHFDRIQRILSGGITWQIIDLSGQVGNYQGKFRVAHQITAT
ncbi:AvrD family protein [Sphingobacterium gobiense]|uniref:Avirulence D protein n=1 Tax=Sphingobacterium gobiense TaxID=1382456 RepID=A0A2S9JNG8_9SPHI|nr:AvrD family protein [Sphingobacterium gobiense]PRD54707.1 hypothetical protein C5749_14840 [Sphingobacterium gobiense]